MTFQREFLVTYTSNAAAFIAQQQQVAAAVVAAQQRINATQAGIARGGAGGVLNPAQLQAITPQIAGLIGQFGRLGTQVRAIQDLGGSASTQIQRMGVVAQQVANLGGPAFANFGAAERSAAQGAIQLRGELENSTATFQRHGQRISETILLYAAFAAAVAGAGAAISLSSTIDRESRRLEAVTGIAQSASHDFIQAITDIAIQTVTPLEGLIGEADRAGAAFLDLPAGAERAAATLLLLGDAGKFTTVTQRDVGVETENLIAIMKQLNIPVADLGDFLGKIVVAGGSSSTVISALADALQISARAAKAAGTDIDTLLAIESRFIITTGRTGSEVGNIINLLFSRLSNPTVVGAVEKVAGGILKMRDAAGALRDPIQILLDMNALLDAGAISATQFNDILSKFAPPLNPQAKQDFIQLLKLLRDLGPAVQEIGQADVSNLDQLVTKLNAALGQQFLQFIEEIKAGFADLFQPEIVTDGTAVINVLRAIRDTIALLPPEVLLGIVQFVALFGALRLGIFVVASMVKLLGFGGIAGDLATARAAAVTAGTAFGGMAAAGVVLRSVLLTLLPVLLAVAAINLVNFAGAIGTAQTGLRQQIGGQAVGRTLPELQALRARVQAERDAKVFQTPLGGLVNPLDAPAVDTLSAALKELDALIAILQGAAPGATVAVGDLSDAFTSSAAASHDAEVASGELTGAYGRGVQLAQEYAASVSNLTDEQNLNAATATNLDSLTDEISASLNTLLDRYRNGTINAKEYADGQAQVARASELAAQLVAAAGKELGQMPLLAAAAAKGDDELTAAIFDLITQAGNSLPIIDATIQRILGIGAAAAAAAAIAAANPIVIRTFIAPVGSSLNFSGKIFAMEQAFAGREAPLNAAATVAAQMQTLLGNLFRTITRGSSTAFGTGPSFSRGGAGAAGPNTSLLDIGDLPTNQLALAIAKAQALQAAIPGANAAAKNDVLNIIKDAEFLRQVKGLDDQLLRKAIEELTDIEKARLEEEKRRNAANEILQNLQVNAGPIGALISQPTLFGAGGSIPAGLNFDPNNGSFVVNLNIGEVNNLTPAQLSVLIEQAVRNAIQSGLRLSGIQ